MRRHEEEFEQRPPRKVWPKAKVRFGKDIKSVRVYTSRYRVVHRTYIYALLALVGIAALLGFFAIEENIRIAGRAAAGGMLGTLLLKQLFSPMRLNDFPKSMSEAGCGGCSSGGGCGGCGS